MKSRRHERATMYVDLELVFCNLVVLNFVVELVYVAWNLGKNDVYFL